MQQSKKPRGRPRELPSETIRVCSELAETLKQLSDIYKGEQDEEKRKVKKRYLDKFSETF